MNKIRIKLGDSEIELEGSDEFINQKLDLYFEKIESQFKKISPSKIKDELLKHDSKVVDGKIPTPAEFYRSKNKDDGISQLLIFAKYLELYKDMTEFSRIDINKIAKEVKLPKDIHSQYFTNAVKQGLLRSHSNNKYSLTLSAEEVLSSM